MPVSKNALIRYKTIDNCLRNRYRKWTLEDLIDACSDALSEFEGRDENVSRRTVQADIQMMRSDKLGYNAPIVVLQNKYYTYEDPDYSITNVPLTEQDTAMMADAVSVLKQLSGFSAFAGMEDIIGRLEDHVSAGMKRSQSSTSRRMTVSRVCITLLRSTRPSQPKGRSISSTIASRIPVLLTSTSRRMS